MLGTVQLHISIYGSSQRLECQGTNKAFCGGKEVHLGWRGKELWLSRKLGCMCLWLQRRPAPKPGRLQSPFCLGKKAYYLRVVVRNCLWSISNSPRLDRDLCVSQCLGHSPGTAVIETTAVAKAAHDCAAIPGALRGRLWVSKSWRYIPWMDKDLCSRIGFSTNAHKNDAIKPLWWHSEETPVDHLPCCDRIKWASKPLRPPCATSCHLRLIHLDSASLWYLTLPAAKSLFNNHVRWHNEMHPTFKRCLDFLRQFLCPTSLVIEKCAYTYMLHVSTIECPDISSPVYYALCMVCSDLVCPHPWWLGYQTPEGSGMDRDLRRWEGWIWEIGKWFGLGWSICKNN